MANEKSSYKWTKFKNGVGSAAIVTLDIIPNFYQNEILEHYSGPGFTSQGFIEEVPEKGYDSWKVAAKHGLEYAFSHIDTCWTVDIYKIEGRAFIDTNPAIVAYTILRAFFDKIDFQLDNKLMSTLEEFILSSWKRPYKELIPDFFNLTFTEFKS